MADTTKDETPDLNAEVGKPAEPHRPHKGVKDAGQTVVGAGDEPFSGTIADITDGDR